MTFLGFNYLIQKHAKSIERKAADATVVTKRLRCPSNTTVELYRKGMSRKDWMTKPEVMVAIETKACDILDVLTRLRDHGYVESRRSKNDNGHHVLEWRWIKKTP